MCGLQNKRLIHSCLRLNLEKHIHRTGRSIEFSSKFHVTLLGPPISSPRGVLWIRNRLLGTLHPFAWQPMWRWLHRSGQTCPFTSVRASIVTYLCTLSLPSFSFYLYPRVSIKTREAGERNTRRKDTAYLFGRNRMDRLRDDLSLFFEKVPRVSKILRLLITLTLRELKLALRECPVSPLFFKYR